MILFVKSIGNFVQVSFVDKEGGITSSSMVVTMLLE